MKTFLFRYRALGLAITIAACVAPAQTAAASVDTSACSDPHISQPFLSWHDSEWYTPMPGDADDSFGGGGWQLSGGATITTTTLADGTTGSVLELPSGSEAVSPLICVTSEYPTVRTMVRDLKGSEGVFFYVSYEDTHTWDTPKNTGQVHGDGTAWSLSTPTNLQPSNIHGWQPVRIILIPGGTTSDFEIYDLFVDPRMTL